MASPVLGLRLPVAWSTSSLCWGEGAGRTSLGYVESEFRDNGVSCDSLALVLPRGLVGTAALCQDGCTWRPSGWKGALGEEIEFSCYLSRFLAKTPCNRRQMNRRKTNGSLITCILSVYMGEPQEK